MLRPLVFLNDEKIDNVFTFVLEWYQKLVDGEFDDAARMLLTDEDSWTGEQICCATRTYGALKSDNPSRLKVTPFASAKGKNPRALYMWCYETPEEESHGTFYKLHATLPIVVVYYTEENCSNGEIGSVEFYYALDGEWSDLATLMSLHNVDGVIRYKLERLDVP